MIYITPNDTRWYNLDDLPCEKWGDVPSYSGYYRVSNYGRIKVVERPYRKEIIMRFEYCKGYPRVTLTKEKIKKHYRVHQLVAQVFIPNPNNLPEVNHKDENPNNCRVDNLEWCTHSYNINYGTRNERVTQKRGMAVDQYTSDGIYIKTFPSMGKAAKSINGSTTSIYYCCNNIRNKTKGYKWKYHDERG